MLGNVFEYDQDCWIKTRNTLPLNGLPIVWKSCPKKSN